MLGPQVEKHTRNGLYSIKEGYVWRYVSYWCDHPIRCLYGGGSSGVDVDEDVL